MNLNPRFTYRDIEGWFNHNRLYDHAVAEAKNGDSLVEIGPWYGKSLAYLASRAKMSGKLLHLYGIDQLRSEQIMENMIRAGVIDIIHLLPIDSTVASLNFPDNSVFFVYLSATENTEKHVRSWLPKVKKGGIIAGQNVYLPDTHRLCENLFGQNYEIWEKESSWYVRV